MARDKNEKLGFKLLFVNAYFALRKVWQYSKTMFGVYILGGLAEALNPIASAYIAGALLAELAAIATGEASRDRLIGLVLFGVTLQLIYMLINSFKGYYLDTKRELFEIDLKDVMLRRQTSMRLEELELPETRDKFSYASSGINETFWYVRSVVDAGSATISIIGTLIVVFATVPWATLILAPVPVFSTLWKYRNFIKTREMWNDRRSHRMRASVIEGMASRESGILELRLYGLTEKLLKLWRKESKISVEVRKSDMQRELKANIIIDLFETAVGVAVDIWLVFRVFSGAISIGLFEQTRRLVSNYIVSLSRLSSSLSDMVVWGVRVNDYREFIAADEVKDVQLEEGKKLRSVPKHIELSNVSFTYPTGDKPAVDGVSLRLLSGENIAIVGENGAGKTTLLKLILGTYTRSGGKILLDNTDIDLVNLNSLYAHVATLFQTFEQFDFMTVGESVSVSGLKHNEPQVIEALKKVGMYDFIKDKPKGLNENIGYVEDDGIQLSGGQWQRLAIARALYKKADILLMDEPTSAIDAKAEQEIMDTIISEYKNKTVINVSHRLSTVSRSDRIIVMKNGRIVEEGTHAKLFVKGTAYYDLFHKQAMRS